jgi:lipopolysaccharide export LptBFGC system permease protein LptF
VREIQVLEAVRFTPADVLLAMKGHERPMELSRAELDRLSRRDPDNIAYQTMMQYLLTFPLANLVLLLVALPLMIGRERGRRMEGLIEGCLLCVFYFCADFLTRALGMEGMLSPIMAAWLPVLVFGSLGIVLLESMRT